MRVFPTRVLLATDGSEEASRAADAAMELCEKTGSELHVVYVRTRHIGGTAPVDPIWAGQTYPELEEDLEREARGVLDGQVQEIEAAGGTVAQTHLEIGDAAERVVALGEDIGAGLVIVGSRGLTRLKRAVMGSVSESIVRYAHCPVLVVRREEKSA